MTNLVSPAYQKPDRRLNELPGYANAPPWFHREPTPHANVYRAARRTTRAFQQITSPDAPSAAADFVRRHDQSWIKENASGVLCF